MFNAGTLECPLLGVTSSLLSSGISSNPPGTKKLRFVVLLVVVLPPEIEVIYCAFKLLLESLLG